MIDDLDRYLSDTEEDLKKSLKIISKARKKKLSAQSPFIWKQIADESSWDFKAFEKILKAMKSSYNNEHCTFNLFLCYLFTTAIDCKYIKPSARFINARNDTDREYELILDEETLCCDLTDGDKATIPLNFKRKNNKPTESFVFLDFTPGKKTK